jgi:hypothetical protein
VPRSSQCPSIVIACLGVRDQPLRLAVEDRARFGIDVVLIEREMHGVAGDLALELLVQAARQRIAALAAIGGAGVSVGAGGSSGGRFLVQPAVATSARPRTRLVVILAI